MIIQKIKEKKNKLNESKKGENNVSSPNETVKSEQKSSRGKQSGILST